MDWSWVLEAGKGIFNGFCGAIGAYLATKHFLGNIRRIKKTMKKKKEGRKTPKV